MLKKVVSKLKSWSFFFIGLSSLIWFLVRVIPKPSRASYPCMKAAAPLASSFVLWILASIASIKAISKMKGSLARANYGSALIFLGVAVVFGTIAFTQTGSTSYADPIDRSNYKQAQLDPNDPMGDAVGIFPGRVVWVYNPDATNEDCDPMEENNSYFEPQNNDQDKIDDMLSRAIQSLTGTENNTDAWDAIFKFHNNTRGKGEVGYQAGEKVFLKINATSGWSGNYNDADLSKVYSSWWGGVNRYYGLSETTPVFMMSVLRQLVDVVGVAQEDIYIGDPMKYIYKHVYEYLHEEFPNIHYLDHDGHEDIGREYAERGTTPVIKYSDRGTVLVDGGAGNGPVYEDMLYKIYEDMEYMLNLPQMKGHVRAGVTMFAKNHFGSHTRGGANHLHNGLMEPGETGLTTRSGYGLYRTQVDLMGHEILGKKNLVYLMDALWSTDHELNPPTKYQMAPFNNDWTSSVFASFDPVAIESVGYDFVRTEFTKERYPTSYEDVVDVIQLEGVCDYLRQAADSENWPEGIEYDPEDDGTIISSLGVHEHWNNDTDMEYSRNLGTGDGIELVKIFIPSTALETPTELSASVVNDSDVELSWIDNNVNETGFVIERKERARVSEFIVLDTVAADVTTYLDDSQKTVSAYYYRIMTFNESNNSKYSDHVLVDGIIIADVEDGATPKSFALNQNYPNPFNPTTTISFNITERADVSLVVYDILGKEVKVLVDQELSAGEYDLKWDGKDYFGSAVASGTYIYKITAQGNKQTYSQTKKMVLVK